MLFSCPDHGQKLAEGGKQEQFSQRVRRSFIEKSASGIHHPGGYFKQLGMSGEELQTAVQDFKTKRATQAKEKETSYQNAQQEIVRLKAQVLYCIVS